MGIPPVVYLGPSAPKEDVGRWLPHAHVRPPARRGDLFRDRMLRYSVFVLIDGAFFQDDAISPREVTDVLRDGAVLIGASSMGALRAVDCGPVGALGVGMIYRLFARGVFSSEDDVAVTFSAERPFPSLTDSLANMRIALRRALRTGQIDRETEKRLCRRCASTYFASRRWPDILDAEDIEDPTLAAVLADVDVKRTDANAAFRFAARCLDAEPALARRPRRTKEPLGVWEEDRTRPADPLGGHDFGTVRSAFALWRLLTGRAPRSAPPLEPLRAIETRESTAEDCTILTGALAGFALPAQHIEDLLQGSSDPSDFGADLMRFAAFCEALSAADHEQIPDNARRLAEQEIATALETSTWIQLIDEIAASTTLRVFLHGFRDDLARAKAFRAYLFGRGNTIS